MAYGSGNAHRDYAYDDLNRLLTDTLATSAGTALASVAYQYDLNSNITSKTVGPAGFAGAGTNSYGYDHADRLTSWTSPANATTAYGWDKASNRTTAGATTYTYDNDNRLTAEAVGGTTTATYSYTPRGTLSSKTGSSAATFTFDAFNRLVGEGSRTYGYDGLDRLANAGGSAFSYAGAEKEAAADGTTTFARTVSGDVMTATTAGVSRHLLADGRGDVVATFAPAGTSLGSSRSFDPWGATVASAGSGDPAVGYQGSWTDPDTGRIGMQARFYSPDTASFASRDSFDVPVTGSATANKWAYGNANPLKFVDPTGQYGEGYKQVNALNNIGINVMLAGAGVAAVAYAAIQATWQAPLFSAGGAVVSATRSIPSMSRFGQQFLGGLKNAWAAVSGGGTAALAARGTAALSGSALATIAAVTTALAAAGLYYAWEVMPWNVHTMSESAGDSVGADSVGLVPSASDIARFMQEYASPGAFGAVPTVAEINAMLGSVASVSRAPGHNANAPLTFTVRGLARPVTVYPSIPNNARVIHTAPVAEVATRADVKADYRDAPVALAGAESLSIGGTGGPTGPQDNRCEVRPGNGMSTCVPPMPDDDRQEPELQPKLDTSGAGARKGGGRNGGNRRLSPTNPRNLIDPRLGDLTPAEIRQIQSVVNRAGRPLEVVGSAALGSRRGIGTDLPIGKGPGTRSDIDYLVPLGSLQHYETTGLYKELPSLDRIIPGHHNPHVGPAIRFEPWTDPFFLPEAGG